MITYTQLYKRVADDCGFSASTTSQALINAQQDINHALRKFKNASRRYWTRKEVKTDLVANQQYYTFPEDMVRVTAIRVTSGGLVLPVTIVDSEELWNRLNLVPAMTVGIPTQAFIKGRNEIGLYPLPSTNYTGGLMVSYESRLKDMATDDITNVSVSVTQNSNIITATSGSFTVNTLGMWFQLNDNSDGNWYQITGFTDSLHVTLENYYQGPTESGKACTIAQVPDIPEEFHLNLVHYACYQYFLKRKAAATAGMYKSLYDEGLRDYKKVYAVKTTGYVQHDLTPFTYNLFNLPPQNVTA